MRQTAAGMGSDMKKEAANQAEQAQQKASESIHNFAEAISKAGAELSAKDEGPAAQLLSQAAGGLEQLSSALNQKKFEEVVGDVRRFGREHPGTFLAGSVLLGIALGRFAQGGIAAGTSAHQPGDQPSSATRPQGGSYGY